MVQSRKRMNRKQKGGRPRDLSSIGDREARVKEENRKIQQKKEEEKRRQKNAPNDEKHEYCLTMKTAHRFYEEDCDDVRTDNGPLDFYKHVAAGQEIAEKWPTSCPTQKTKDEFYNNGCYNWIKDEKNYRWKDTKAGKAEAEAKEAAEPAPAEPAPVEAGAEAPAEAPAPAGGKRRTRKAKKSKKRVTKKAKKSAKRKSRKSRR